MRIEPFVQCHPIDRQTDRQKDKQTDRDTQESEASRRKRPTSRPAVASRGRLEHVGWSRGPPLPAECDSLIELLVATASSELSVWFCTRPDKS